MSRPVATAAEVPIAPAIRTDPDRMVAAMAEVIERIWSAGRTYTEADLIGAGFTSAEVIEYAAAAIRRATSSPTPLPPPRPSPNNPEFRAALDRLAAESRALAASAANLRRQAERLAAQLEQKP